MSRRGDVGDSANPAVPARRRLLIACAGLAALPLANRASAQAPGQLPGIPGAPLPPLDPNVQAFARGREVRVGRVQVVLPLLADNGNSVSLKVTVESPMTAADHVKAIALVSSRNPEPNMARFFLGPRAGRAEVSTRVRLAGSQRVMAVAEMSDGTFWVGSRDIVVTHSACVDES
jgi:sulfur-oxidizing protein SoxY